MKKVQNCKGVDSAALNLTARVTMTVAVNAMATADIIVRAHAMRTKNAYGRMVNVTTKRRILQDTPFHVCLLQWLRDDADAF